ncbi:MULTISPECIES: ScpA family protein [unclassified Oleiphilus]|uniref:segregation and condensation protein A n=1 Tax=unclassified Oleiphilus TaxID=2631174 RepID=UPI0009EDE91B|nr:MULTISPECIES: ScpA family protein [unclassified Oleiphilus]
MVAESSKLSLGKSTGGPVAGQSTDTSGVQQDLPLAFVDGKPVTAIPQDLYIPPDALSVILQAFEGPLDLLLYLIRKQNMDILNIDVCEITRQYMKYIEAARSMKFELAAEYLLMAAMLAEIKSRMLLPKPKAEDGEEIDPRAELIRRLQQYERYKQAAEDINALPRFDQDYFSTRVEAQIDAQANEGPDVSLDDLMIALKGVLERSDHFSSHHIERETLSTRERMSSILSALSDVAYQPFEEFFLPEEGRQGVVVTFLAIMELVKEQLLELIQVNTFGAIHVRARMAS